MQKVSSPATVCLRGTFGQQRHGSSHDTCAAALFAASTAASFLHNFQSISCFTTLMQMQTGSCSAWLAGNISTLINSAHSSSQREESEAWCVVGRRGKHKRVPHQAITSIWELSSTAQTDPRTALSLKPFDAAQPASDGLLNFATLPGVIVSIIFSHLDCKSASQLALTCHACAAVYTQSKALKRKWLLELAPAVIRKTP